MLKLQSPLRSVSGVGIISLRWWSSSFCLFLTVCVVIPKAAAGAEASSAWSVKATQCRDTKPPNITCPLSTTFYGSSPVLPNVVVYRPIVEDDCVGVAIKSQVPRPGSHLSPSSTPYNVTVTVVDHTNKTGSCQWSVTVPPVVASEFVRAKVYTRNQPTWVPSTTVVSRRGSTSSKGGYVTGIAVRTAQNGQLRQLPNQILRFYAYTRMGGRTDILRFRCNATAAARSSRGKRLYLSHPVMFGTDEGSVTIRMVSPSPPPRTSSTNNTISGSTLLRSTVTEVRVALLMQYIP